MHPFFRTDIIEGDKERRLSMEDSAIIDLFFARNEQAIEELKSKFGPLCLQLAGHMLHDPQDAEECVSDAYLGVWNSIPPERPTYLRAFLCKFVRNCSLKRLEYLNAKKRSRSVEVSFEELEKVLLREDDRSEQELGELINKFLYKEKPLQRQVFLRKYWFFDTIEDISAMFGCSQSNVKVMLSRTRQRLKKFLEQEGISL